MRTERLIEIERLHGTEPAPPWAGELLEEVRRLHGRADALGVQVCPGCHRPLPAGDDVLVAHQQAHNQEGGNTVTEREWIDSDMTNRLAEAFAQMGTDAYQRGYDVATARAVSRLNADLPIEREQD